MHEEITKVFLYAFPQLEGFSEALSAAAENKAVLSFRKEKTLEAAAAVAEDLALAERLRALKEDVLRVLSILGERERALVGYKYFREGKSGDGFEFANCSKRSYFRMQCALLRRVTAAFVALGWSDERFFEEFSGYPPFLCALRAVREGRDRVACAHPRYGSRSSEGEARFPRRTKTPIATAATSTMQQAAICTPSEAPFELSFGGSSSALSPGPAGTER